MGSSIQCLPQWDSGLKWPFIIAKWAKALCGHWTNKSHNWKTNKEILHAHLFYSSREYLSASDGPPLTISYAVRCFKTYSMCSFFCFEHHTFIKSLHGPAQHFPQGTDQPQPPQTLFSLTRISRKTLYILEWLSLKASQSFFISCYHLITTDQVSEVSWARFQDPRPAEHCWTV